MTIREALEKARGKLMADIDDAMTHEVFEEVRGREARAIYTQVYKAYEPILYARRGDYGGLGDERNIEIEGGAAKNGRMAVVNLTEPNPGGAPDSGRVTTGKNLPELVEYGNGYKGYRYDFTSGNGSYLAPRPFTAKTAAGIKRSGAHIRAMKAGLKRRGVKVK